MRYFLDTEFNGFGGQLISMGIAPSDGGKPLYLARRCPSPTPWVAANVLPKLAMDPKPRFVESSWGHLLKDYLGLGPVEIVADWPEDLMHFLAELLVSPGNRVRLQPTLTLLNQSDLPPVVIEQAIPHHALWDAIALRAQYRMMRKAD